MLSNGASFPDEDAYVYEAGKLCLVIGSTVQYCAFLVSYFAIAGTDGPV